MLVNPTYLRSILPCLVFTAACAASSDGALRAPLDTDFQLGVGQAAFVAETDLKLGFAAVISDSRCPKGEACFLAGDGVVRIWMQVNGGEQVEHDLHTARQGPKFAEQAGYRVHLVALEPLPVSGIETAAKSYVATFRATQK